MPSSWGVPILKKRHTHVFATLKVGLMDSSFGAAPVGLLKKLETRGASLSGSFRQPRWGGGFLFGLRPIPGIYVDP